MCKCFLDFVNLEGKTVRSYDLFEGFFCLGFYRNRYIGAGCSRSILEDCVAEKGFYVMELGLDLLGLFDKGIY